MPFSLTSSSGQKRLSVLNFHTWVAFFSIERPVYSLVFGSHSSNTKVSPSLISKSFSRKSYFFLPEYMASNNSGQVFFFMVFMVFGLCLVKLLYDWLF